MSNNPDNPQVNADELDKILEQAFTDGASDTMWQNDRHVEVFAEAKRRLLADRQKHVLDAKLEAAEFFKGTLSDRELRELSRTTLRTWQMWVEHLKEQRSKL